MTFYRASIIATLVLVVVRATVSPAMPWWVAWGPLIVCGAWSVFVLVVVFVDLFFGRVLEERAARRRLWKKHGRRGC